MVSLQMIPNRRVGQITSAWERKVRAVRGEDSKMSRYLVLGRQMIQIANPCDEVELPPVTTLLSPDGRKVSSL